MRIAPEKRDEPGLVDRWGDLRLKAECIAKEIEALKAEFERRGLTIAAGARWAVLKKSSSFGALDVKAVRYEMGPEWCKARETERSRTEYAFAPVADPASTVPPLKEGRARRGGQMPAASTAIRPDPPAPFRAGKTEAA